MDNETKEKFLEHMETAPSGTTVSLKGIQYVKGPVPANAFFQMYMNAVKQKERLVVV